MMPLNKETILKYAGLYDEKWKGSYDEKIEVKMRAALLKQRYLTKSQLVELGDWKSRRPGRWYRLNDEQAVREITKFSLATTSEWARVNVLLALSGVKFPTASVILHFAFPERYAIMDFRAIWSLGWKQPKSYSFEFWDGYCEKMRVIAKKFGVSLRTVDKALWRYSADHQE